MDITKFTKNLELDENGIWYSKINSQVNYPQEGNELYFEIEENSFWFKHRNNCIRRILEHYPPTGTFFDVGGGNGVVSLTIQAMGLDVVLIEPGKIGALNSKQNGIQSVICSTVEDAGFLENSIPAIGLFDVLEHIEDDQAFLVLLNRLLIPGGKLYLTVPAYRILWSNEDNYAEHFKRYSTTELIQKLSSSGFNYIYSTYIFSFLLLPIILIRTIPSRLGFRRTISMEQEINEHRHPTGIVGSLLNKLSSFELSFINNRKAIPFGGSCLVIVEKI